MRFFSVRGDIEIQKNMDGENIFTAESPRTQRTATLRSWRLGGENKGLLLRLFRLSVRCTRQAAPRSLQ